MRLYFFEVSLFSYINFCIFCCTVLTNCLDNGIWNNPPKILHIEYVCVWARNRRKLGWNSTKLMKLPINSRFCQFCYVIRFIIILVLYYFSTFAYLPHGKIAALSFKFCLYPTYMYMNPPRFSLFILITFYPIQDRSENIL